MKFTLSWLKEHRDTEATLAELRHGLTMLGLEVEGVSNPAEQLKGFVVGYVVEAVQHPNADRLRLCKVDIGSGSVIQVVCGAPNARTGMKAVFAPPGSYIPGTDLHLKASKIRGEASNGMLCSSRELQLGDDHSGIIDLPADTLTGRPAAARSRAMPRTPRQSGRLGVTLISITGSSRPSASAAGRPVFVSAGRSMMPS